MKIGRLPQKGSSCSDHPIFRELWLFRSISQRFSRIFQQMASLISRSSWMLRDQKNLYKVQGPNGIPKSIYSTLWVKKNRAVEIHISNRKYRFVYIYINILYILQYLPTHKCSILQIYTRRVSVTMTVTRSMRSLILSPSSSLRMIQGGKLSPHSGKKSELDSNYPKDDPNWKKNLGKKNI